MKASPSLDVLCGGLGISTGKSQFFIHRIHLKYWIRIRIGTNADPKHWFPQPPFTIIPPRVLFFFNCFIQ
jgi:hypothetical protein